MTEEKLEQANELKVSIEVITEQFELLKQIIAKGHLIYISAEDENGKEITTTIEGDNYKDVLIPEDISSDILKHIALYYEKGLKDLNKQFRKL